MSLENCRRQRKANAVGSRLKSLNFRLSITLLSFLMLFCELKTNIKVKIDFEHDSKATQKLVN